MFCGVRQVSRHPIHQSPAGTMVQPPVSVRNLSVSFDADLSLTAHVNQLTARCYRSLRRINSYRRATPDQLPQEHINKAAANFTKRLTTCVAATAIGGHFEHLQ